MTTKHSSRNDPPHDAPTKSAVETLDPSYDRPVVETPMVPEPSGPVVSPAAGPLFNVIRNERQRFAAGTQGYTKIIDLTMDSVNPYPAGGFPIPGETPGLVWGVQDIAETGGFDQYVVGFNLTTGYMQIFGGVTEFSGTFPANTIFRVVVWAY